jgi:MoaA/NifB/PqqE/SkfB family radical SAM enzyme
VSARLDDVLAGMRAGRPATGPLHVHIDVTNTCNAACVTCWDHSPLLETPRPAVWKRRRMPVDRFTTLLDAFAAMGSVEGVVISGMGEPLTHPDIYGMLAAVKARGWHLTLMTNLVAADIDRLAPIGVDQVLVGVQGVTPRTHMAFHPGWTEEHFFTLCAHLRALGRTGARVRHVHVINRDTVAEVPEMVRFGLQFGADRVNFKLASLADGTEACAIDATQRAWLLAEAIPLARTSAARLRVLTNLDLFERQVRAGGLATVPIADVGCHMGYVYTRVTVDEEVLYCCNTEVKVGSLRESSFATLWQGERWQALRGTLGAGHFLRGCERCGKFEQNVKWAEKLRATAS